jgi:hypothetical protein
MHAPTAAARAAFAEELFEVLPMFFGEGMDFEGRSLGHCRSLHLKKKPMTKFGDAHGTLHMSFRRNPFEHWEQSPELKKIPPE